MNYFIFFIMVVVFVFVIYNIVKETRLSKNAPILTVSTYMVRKYITSSDDGPDYYKAEFALDDGRRLHLDVEKFGYRSLPLSGSCIITYKHRTLLDFKYLGAIDEKKFDPVKEKERRRR